MAKIHPLLLIGGGLVALELFRPGSTPLRGLLQRGAFRLPGATPVQPAVSPWERLGIQTAQSGIEWLGGVLGDWFRQPSAAEAAEAPYPVESWAWPEAWAGEAEPLYYGPAEGYDPAAEMYDLTPQP